jgi:iron complex outermembrane receptor protein
MTLRRARRRLLDLIIAAVFAAAGSLPAFASEMHQFSVPAEDGSDAVRDFAAQAHVQIMVAAENVRDKNMQAVNGWLSTDQGLHVLLSGSGLAPQYVDDHSIALVPAVHGSSASTAGESDVVASSSPVPDKSPGDEASNKRIRLAQTTPPDQGASGTKTEATSDSKNNAPESRLSEIVVTAQKKTERLQDVPMSITVLDPQALAEKGQNSLLDYFDSVPGLNVAANATGYPGADFITIRGLSAGAFQNPIVATTIDDVPVAASVSRSLGGLTSPDLDPSDLARIEILKGPQGTLYGADSLGGLMKYVTADPSTESLSGRVQVSGVDIPGGSLGYAVRGAVNIPVSDTLAFRVSGFERRDPGYIDDLTTGRDNFNTTDVYGGHLAAFWRPSDNFSLKLSALVQQTAGETSTFDSNNSGQSDYSDLGLHSLPGTTAYTNQDQLYTATINWKVAGLNIVSVTGYVVNSVRPSVDITTGLGYQAYYCPIYPNPFLPSGQPNSYYCGNGLPPGANPNAYAGAPFLADISTHKPTQEFRIGSTIGQWFDWRLGGFYTHEEGVPNASGIYSANPVTGAVQSVLYAGTDPTETFWEYAFFGDATVHITDRFDIEMGGRESRNKQADQTFAYGPGVYLFDQVVPPKPDLGTYHEYSGNAFTYQLAPRFKITPDMMVYARVASGYRIGGYNVLNGLPVSGQIPAGYAPDKTTNYELGVKTNLFDRRLTLDAAVYYIDWKDFQTSVGKTVYLPAGATDFIGYTVNAGNAKSEGVEMSLEAHPLEGLTITAQGSYDDAVLTQDLPDASTVYGVKGTQLPYSMRFSGGLTARQDIRLTNTWIGSVGGGFNYVGSRPFEFVGAPGPGQAPSPRTIFPAYRTINLLAGARHDLLRVNIYVNNVTNARGILSFGGASSVGNPYEDVSSVIQPRTVGLSISRNF